MLQRKTGLILGQPVEVATMEAVTTYLLDRAEFRDSFSICFTTAHMLVKTRVDPAVNAAYASAAMILPDGVPVAWCLHSLGHTEAECISGPRLTPMLLIEAAKRGIPVGFYGGREETLDRMAASLARELPTLQISYIRSPPFRTLSHEERATDLREIEASGARLLFVGLGSPKQEIWMHENTPYLRGVCLGVGAAFEFLSGEKYLPPLWVQRLGLTWFIRLCQEPRRLLVRNLYSPIFVFLFLKERLLGSRLQPPGMSEDFGD